MDTHKQVNNSERIAFAATVPLEMRPEVEALFFFNSKQPLLQEGIHTAILQTGMPTIAESDDRVWIDVPSGRTQCLFACDEQIKPFQPVGVVLYSRPVVDTIWINHVAIDPDYAYGGENATLDVAALLVRQVMAIARSIRGVTRIQLPYRERCYLRVKRPESMRAKRPGG